MKKCRVLTPAVDSHLQLQCCTCTWCLGVWLLSLTWSFNRDVYHMCISQPKPFGIELYCAIKAFLEYYVSALCKVGFCINIFMLKNSGNALNYFWILYDLFPLCLYSISRRYLILVYWHRTIVTGKTTVLLCLILINFIGLCLIL